MSSRERLITIIVVAASLFGLSTFWWGPIVWRAIFGNNTEEVGAGIRYVKAKKVELRDLNRTITAIGTLRASNFVNIKAERRARVAKIYFEDGQMIKQGEPIIELDKEALTFEHKGLQAQADQLKQQYLRSKELHDKKLLSDTDFEKAKAEYTRVQAAADEKKVLLDKSIVRAPFEGRLGVRDADVTVGTFIADGTDIVTLVDTDPMFVDFRVSAQNTANIKPGQKIEVEVDGPGGSEMFVGEVTAVDSKVETTGNTVLVRGKVENPNDKLQPGQFARVTVITHAVKNAMMVPLSAIRTEGNNDLVFVMDGNTVAVRGVVKGQTSESDIEIVKGITKDDIVVFEGKKNLHPGVKVVNLYKEPTAENKKEKTAASSDTSKVVEVSEATASAETPKPEAAVVTNSKSSEVNK